MRSNSALPLGPPLLLASNLRWLKTALYVDWVAVSRRTKVPRQTIYNWLGGQTPNDLRQLKRVAADLRRTVDELCFTDISKGAGLAVAVENVLVGVLKVDSETRLEISVRKV